ncbi:SH3 domain-containing kinase-binding protein 1 isoform X2 [Ambystoma mexicanum]|uniref:SH3 domain-containing kinase-binding protein 1 isoform X2 n=1 Tax=Ambystoma mexicanum TaxID=8296 RepID=UPI0037E7C969
MGEETIGRKLPPAASTQEPVKLEIDGRTKPKEYCKVLFPYEAQNEDELSIREGDTVAVINKDCVDAGWWEGEVNGRRGMFPDNFVKLLPSEFERDMNRPKKPPPPAATVLKSGTGTTERRHDVRKVPPERPETLPNREEKERAEREQKLLDLHRPTVPAIPPKKPRPPKSNSLNRPGTLPPRRPERPAVTAPSRSDSPKSELLASTVSSTPEKDSSERSNDIDLEGFDAVVSAGGKLNHPTASRPKAGGRRPPSQSLTSSSLSSPDIFDSPSPDEEKDELASVTPKPADISKKAPKTVTISQVSDNRAALPPKPGGLASIGGNAQPGTAPFSAFHPVTSGTTAHRSNSPSLFSTEGKPKTEQLSHGQSAMDELRMQVKDLRSIVETMKDQQKREIKQLLTELDEEKKIRLRLQMEVNEIKKTLQSK